MSQPSKYDNLSRWITDMLDGRITETDFQRLQQTIHGDPASLRYYVEYLSMWALLEKQAAQRDALQEHATDQNRETILELLAQNEQTAHALKVFVSDPESPAPTAFHRSPAPTRRFTRRDVGRFIGTIAAIIVIALGIVWLDRNLMTPPGQSHTKVARIRQEIEAHWDYAGLQFKAGEWLWNGEYHLESGYAELGFLNGARVILEGPARFKLVSADTMTLLQGRLFATVTKEAIGFTVNTVNSKVVDLGTEFGVSVDAAGNTDLHVLKGKTQLVARKLGQTQLVAAGAAKRIDSNGTDLFDIQPDGHAFVRRIDQHTGLVWKGRSLDLADVVGGGNGFGTGRYLQGIDVISGQTTRQLPEEKVYIGPDSFIPVADNPLIDGVFVPCGGDRPVTVSSTGITTTDFPATTRRVWGHPLNGAIHRGHGVPYHNLALDGMTLGAGQSALTLHSNLGLTFDLGRIRASLPGLTATAFRARAGLSQSTARYSDQTTRTEFRVLIDGQQKFHRLARASDDAFDINVPIGPEDRFLTLAVTEADDSTPYDWALFAQPRLILDTHQ